MKKNQSLYDYCEVGKTYGFDITIPGIDRGSRETKGMVDGTVIEKVELREDLFLILDGERGVNLTYVTRVVGPSAEK